MKKIAMALVLMGAGWMLRSMFDGASPRAEAVGGLGGGVEKCAGKNGDVNGSGVVDLSDAVTVLGNLFLGNPTELLPLCTSSAARGLPDTGQRKCYRVDGSEFQCGGVILPTSCPFQGQDAQLPTGCPNDANRFTDNGDGTVTDNCTGLMWQQRTADVNNDGQSTFSLDSIPWCNALSFCINLGLAGHDDWRLPNVRELESIVDYGREGIAIDPVFSAFVGPYWSSTSIAGFPEAAWVVEFFDGASTTCVRPPTPSDSGCCDKSCQAYVRAVRGGP